VEAQDDILENEFIRERCGGTCYEKIDRILIWENVEKICRRSSKESRSYGRGSSIVKALKVNKNYRPNH